MGGYRGWGNGSGCRAWHGGSCCWPGRPAPAQQSARTHLPAVPAGQQRQQREAGPSKAKLASTKQGARGSVCVWGGAHPPVTSASRSMPSKSACSMAMTPASANSSSAAVQAQAQEQQQQIGSSSRPKAAAAEQVQQVKTPTRCQRQVAADAYHTGGLPCAAMQARGSRVTPNPNPEPLPYAATQAWQPRARGGGLLPSANNLPTTSPLGGLQMSWPHPGQAVGVRKAGG